MKTVSKYFLLQIPGWILLGVILYLAWRGEWISKEIAWGILALGFLKDLILYPFLRKAYEPGGRSGSAHLIGTLGVTREPLKPSGYIQINGELWQARVEGVSQSIDAGTEVRITATQGLTLIVELKTSGSKSILS